MVYARTTGTVAMFICALVLSVETVNAETRTCSEYGGEIVSAQGSVDFRSGNGWQPASLGQLLCDSEAVRTGPNSRAAIRLVDDAVLRLDENTTLVLSDVAPEPEKPSLLQLVFGAFHSFSRDPQTLEVDTPYVNATVEGTEFALRVAAGVSTLTVIEGLVLAQNDLGAVQVAAGNAAIANAGAAPRSVAIVRSDDAVAWGLYYPHTLSFAEAAASPALTEAARLWRENRPDQAIAVLESGPGRTGEIRLYQAALLLSVGRVDEAGAVLRTVLDANPSNASALAQMAVIDIVRNDTERGLATAERAVAADPDSAAANIALSYAQQADFRLEDARDTLLSASARIPDSALIWTRLSEIWLTLGYRNRSGQAAARALELDPQLSRAIVMKGFAALTEFRTGPAAEAFEQAITLDPADPLPRLGLGLAKIRDGDLEAGRGEIDAAVALDSNRSLFRSYLGKAYFEEDRNEIARQQLEIAKELDPQDPTPYLYDAIGLQTENRPGEALAAIQESIARNDNRAVYRGRLQLDQDQAARRASLGRIYEDLGFIALGMREATRSQALDPANAAAHRFLADIYRNERRRELSRVSELTRAQLLQDVNLNPVQPSMTETNLNLVAAGGPANAGFNEFTSLFASDGFRFTGSGVLGTDTTIGGEAALALQADGVSVSFGGFEFRSDGFRDNFDVSHSIYDLFVQWAVTPEFNIQVEGRHRSTENGDLALNFDPDSFDPILREEFTEHSARLGLRYSADPHNTTLASVIYADRETKQTSAVDFGFPVTIVIDGQEDAVIGELQHIYQRNGFNLTLGVSYSESTVDGSAFFPDFPFFPPTPLDLDAKDFRPYAYATVELPFDATLTAGISYDDLENGPIKVSEVNPKAGIEWSPLDDLTLRAAYVQAVKPPLATNRTIEPTQVAGFNQYFDDRNGTISERYGLGFDWKVAHNIFVGGEATWRHLDTPFVDIASNTGEFVNHNEQTHRLYLNALPHPRVATSIELVYDKFGGGYPSFFTNEDRQESEFPLKVKTLSVPVTVRYFDPSGFFAGVRGTYVNQEVKRVSGSIFAGGQSDFFVVDADVGYRFPHQRGSVSLAVRNLFDQDFKYQDDGFREFGDDPSTGPYFPDLTILGRLTINF